jgi:hypothetical protein
MLPAAMRRVSSLAILLIALASALGLASCGGEEPGGAEAAEGEPVVLDDVSYNVGITRFLNPDDPEDAAYLVGQPPAPGGEYYLGVFIEIINESDETRLTAGDYVVADTLDTEYHPLPSDSLYALEIGRELTPDGQLPVPDTTAATGPNEGSLLLFRVHEDVSDNRPLKLEIDAAGETGEVILDI